MKKEKIEFRANFKKANLFNDTLHIIVYPRDGLRTAVKLQEIEEGTEVIISLRSKTFKCNP
jgi:hypothetical protein